MPNTGHSYDEMQHGPLKDYKTPIKVKKQFQKANNRERHHTSDSALPSLQNNISQEEASYYKWAEPPSPLITEVSQQMIR